MAAAKELLAAQRQLLYENFGDAFVILDRFDFGPQVLFALAQRQRTHGDGVSFFISGLLQLNVCCCATNYINFCLLFVVVTYLTDGANKTSFANRARFKVCDWQDEMLKLLSKLRKGVANASNDVIALVNTLKNELEHQDALSLQPDSETTVETFLFDGRNLHWGNASKDLRFVVYSQAVHRSLLDKIGSRDLRKTVLTTYYSAEYVVDRRTIASPTYLHNLWLYNSSDVLKISESNIAKKAHDLWERLHPLGMGLDWPSAVCQCCLINDEDNMVLCTAKDCCMGAIHSDCIPLVAKAKGWKCSSCLTSGQ